MDGLKELTTYLAKVETELKDPKWLFEATEHVTDEAKRRARVHTGELASSIYNEVRRTEDGMEGVVYTDNEHARYVEFGTGPKGNGTYPYLSGIEYKPTPWSVEKTKAPGLADYAVQEITWNGEERYKLYGQVAKPFMYPALKENEEKVIEIANKGIKRALRSK